MRTIEELEALLEVATRERDEARAELAFILAEYANERNEELTEDALCLKIAGLTHQRDEARRVLSEILALWPYLNCVCGRNKPRLSEALREAAKKVTT